MASPVRHQSTNRRYRRILPGPRPDRAIDVGTTPAMLVPDSRKRQSRSRRCRAAGSASGVVADATTRAANWAANMLTRGVFRSHNITVATRPTASSDARFVLVVHDMHAAQVL